MASTECELDYTKKEYAIVGDDVFFSLDNSSGMPPWLEEYIKNLTYRSIYELYNGYEGGLWDALGLGNILAPGFNIFDLSANLLNALRNLEVAKNDYKFYVDKKITDSMAYVATLETLNASIGSNDATIKNLQLTYADQFNAVASQISLLTAKTDTSNAEIANVRTAVATQTGALAQRIDSLIASYTDQDNKLTAIATAVQSLEAFSYTFNNELIAQAQDITALEAVVTDENGNQLAGSSVTTGDVAKTVVNNATGDIASYTMYSKISKINIGGQEYLDGFGTFAGALPSKYANSTPDDRVHYSSFWVAADTFKVYDPNLLTSSDVEWETVQIYDPVLRQNVPKQLVKNIKNAQSIFSVDTVNKRVEINGDLVVNGTITANEMAAGSAGDLIYTSGTSYTASGANGVLDLINLQVPSTSIASSVYPYGKILLEFSGVVEATYCYLEIVTETGSVIASQEWTVPKDIDGGAASRVGTVLIRNIQPYLLSSSPTYKVRIAIGESSGVYSSGTIKNYILTGTVVKR